MIVREVRCKSVLTRSGIPSVDYAVNPYVGCAHACRYCYAVFMKRFTGHDEEWGEFVDVKVNAAEVLERQLRRAKSGNVSLGTVTDAYQELEHTYGVTRGCLLALGAKASFPTTVLTKSALVLRDLDVLRKMPALEVAFTITTLDDSVRSVFEPRASTIQQRLDALGELHEADIHTWAFFGPVLPALSDHQEQIDGLFAALAAAGVAYVLVDTLNLRGAQWGRLRTTLRDHFPELLGCYAEMRQDRESYAHLLAQRVARASQRCGLPFELAW